MPKRTDINKILVLGSGPIVIGQACEFDYSGTQAIKALMNEGYEVSLVNSNPATIMTDPKLACKTYIEPLVPESLEAIIKKEKPDAILPTVGGQTALNLCLDLHNQGILEKYNVEVIGAKPESIYLAEDRQAFRQAMAEIGLGVPSSKIATQLSHALEFAGDNGYPVVIRPSFTLGGSGGGLVYNEAELIQTVTRGLDLSPVNSVLVEKSLIGWKEFELEVVRDLKDQVIIICSIENLDPMGVHTGDSITVAPAQTLSDREYQRMRDAAQAILRKIAVDTGGSNVQFAVNPKDGEMIVIEMNPRVSRSSALASKATGFPIAKVAALLSVGYTLDELPNDITKVTPACFEPTLDYVVTKVPRFAFEKFPEASPLLGTQMKSVGEVMAMGRTFKESFFKALRSLEQGPLYEPEEITEKDLSTPKRNRLRSLVFALEQGWSVEKIHELTHFDPWFIRQIEEFAIEHKKLRQQKKLPTKEELFRLKGMGFSDRRLDSILQLEEGSIKKQRVAEGVHPIFKMVDTCAAEFDSNTPYFYSSYDQENESIPTQNKKVLILGSGPNRIGQGIEFDYCCCHASYAAKECEYESILVNSNPETVSTDYDTSDRLYFEPLTFEDVHEIIQHEKPEGIIVQFGGQTPLNLAKPLADAGVNIFGTSAESIELAEDRERFNKVLLDLNINYPVHTFVFNEEEALAFSKETKYPLLVRPSFVLGGRAMAVVHNDDDLIKAIRDAKEVSQTHPILIDRFLEAATEIDVDAISDGETCIVAGVLQHIEEAGVHSGDSSCTLPPISLSDSQLKTIKEWTKKIAKALKVQGLMNIQFAICQEEVFVLEVNPRASRTVPFVAKASGLPIASIATKVMLGKSLKELGFEKDLEYSRYFTKSPVFPFKKFPTVDPQLSPEMKSTGEVMGHSSNAAISFYKAQLAAGTRLPNKGNIFITVNDQDKEKAIGLAKSAHELGFNISATTGTAAFLNDQFNGEITVNKYKRANDGRPNCVDEILNGQVDLVINTPLGRIARKDGAAIRQAAVQKQVPLYTTIEAAAFALEAIKANAHSEVAELGEVVALQDM